MHRYIVFCICLGLSFFSGCSSSSSVRDMSASDLQLTNGDSVKQYTISNDHISLTVVPALGGKITSLKSRLGREYLSRSKRPYVMRRYGMPYGETEFDGIDECFPSLATSSYPEFPWKDRPIPDHGEVCQLPWDVVKKSDSSITMHVRGKAFAYLFTRTISLDGRSVHIDYRVDNLSANAFHCYYAFHPLLAGEDGCRLTLPDDCRITMSTSAKGYLGEKGTSADWGSYLDKSGKLFKDNQYDSSSSNYYKYYTEKLKTGHVRLDYKDGFGLTMRWPHKLFPYLAVWCSQGAVGGLQHIAPEPVSSIHDGLLQAHKHKQSIEIKGNGNLSWQIELTVEEPVEETTND